MLVLFLFIFMVVMNNSDKLTSDFEFREKHYYDLTPTHSRHSERKLSRKETQVKNVFDELDLTREAKDCELKNTIGFSPEIAKLTNDLYRIAEKYHLSDPAVLALRASLPKSYQTLSKIVDFIFCADEESRQIYLYLLRNWSSGHKITFLALAEFFSTQSSEQNQSHLSFFYEYGSYSLFKNELTIDLTAYFISREGYRDFFVQGAQRCYKRHLLAAMQIGCCKEFVCAYDAAVGPEAKTLVMDFILGLASQKLEDSKDLSACRWFLKWLTCSPISWKILEWDNPQMIVDRVSLYLHYNKQFAGLDFLELDLFIQGIQKDMGVACKLLDFFKDLSVSPAAVFLEWVNASEGDVNTVATVLLGLPRAWSDKHRKILIKFLCAINKISPEIPKAEMAALLLEGRPESILTICKWVGKGEETLASMVCVAIASGNDILSRIGRLALMQEAENARILVLLMLGDFSAYPSFLPNRIKPIRQEQFRGITEEVFFAVCGKEGVEAMTVWMNRNLGIVQPKSDSKESVSDLFFKLSPEMKESLLCLCCLTQNIGDRTHLLKILSTYPSRHFAKFILANSDSKFIEGCLRAIPDASDLKNIIRVYTAISNNTSVESRSRKRSAPVDSVDVVKGLRKAKPELKKIVNLILKDGTPLGRRILVAMADWRRYGYSDQLAVFFQHHPLKKRMSSSGIIDLQEELNWKAAVTRLECGRFGYIEDVLIAVGMDEHLLQARAIDACWAFENPPLLRHILSCDLSDDESLEILNALIADPTSSWTRFLLHVKMVDRKGSYQPILNNSPLTFKVIQKLVERNQFYLAQQLAENKDLKSAAKHLGFSGKINPQVDDGKIDKAWKKSNKVVQAAKEGRRTSLPIYEYFRESEEYVEEYQEVVVALSMAEAIMHEGVLSGARIRDALKAIPKAIFDTDHYEYLKNTLNALGEFNDLRDKIAALAPDFKLSAEGSAIVNALFSRPSQHPITPDEIRVTLLSALLCRCRQSLEIGSCFATSESIRLPSSHEGLSIVLEHYKQILSGGSILLFTGQENEMESLPVLPRLLQLDLGQPLAHPLVKAFEYALAIRGRIKSQSAVRKARNAIFGPGGFLETPLLLMYENYQKTHPWDSSFDVSRFLIDLSRQFDLACLEVFNPKIKQGNRFFSGWELVSRKNLQAVSNIDEYKRLYMQVVQNTLATCLPKGVTGQPRYSLIHAIGKEVMPYFNPEKATSEIFVDYLRKELSLASTADLWCHKSGGHQMYILASHQRKRKYPISRFTPQSGENAFHHLLQYCYDLPEKIKDIAEVHSPYYLPFSIPKHSLNLLPSPLLTLLKQHDTPQGVLDAMRQDSLNAGGKRITHDEGAQLARQIQDEVALQATPKLVGRLADAFALYNFEGVTIQELADICLKEISLAGGYKQMALREAMSAIDEILWYNLSFVTKVPVYVFADANWRSEEHNNTLLAFAWSFAGRRLEVVTTSKDPSNISFLGMHTIGEKGWELYPPPLTQAL